MNVRDRSPDLASSGVPRLDDVLSGGFRRRRLYLIEGMPGCGKTTLALQFLMAGRDARESVLYITLSETLEELADVAQSHGWSLEGVELKELTPEETSLGSDEQNTMFYPSEIEMASTMKHIVEVVERCKPSRVVVDSLSEFRLLAGNALRYRRQLMALKHFLNQRACTVMLLDDMTATDHDLQMHSMSHAVLLLEQLNPEYGSERRRLRVVKYRGVQFRGGYHDYRIVRGGLEVFPRLVAAEHRQVSDRSRMPSGVPELDLLLGGGIEEGTSTLIIGAPGTGKSSVAAQFVAAAAARGQCGALFVFDESPRILLSRCRALGIQLGEHVDNGRVRLQQVDPAELTPGAFIQGICEAVEKHDTRIIVIDSLNGYINAMPLEQHLIIQLHELFIYLGQKGVATILIGAQHGLLGPQMTSPLDASYLADAVILLRYFEDRGSVRKAISVVKKRGGKHERSLREFRLDEGRLSVGAPLREFRGVLTGVPVYEGSPAGSPSKDDA